MLGLIKSKKIKTTVKALTAATDNALDQVMLESSDKLLERLGLSRQQVFDAITSDDEVESCREDLRTGLLAKEWRLYGDGANDDEVDVLYRIVRKQLPVLAEIVLTAKLNGYAVARYVYEYDEDGFLTLKAMLNKSGELDKFTPKADGTLVYSGAGDEKAVDLNVQYLLLTNRATTVNPAGEAAAARLYPAVALRKQGFTYAAQFIKRYAQPYIVGKIEGGETEHQNFVSKLFSFISGGALSISREDDVQLLQNSADGAAFQKLERMANTRIQKVLLGKVKTADLENGSRAAQQTEEATKGDRLDGYAALLGEAVQHLVDALLLVNQAYGRPITAPKGLWFEFRKEDEIDVQRAERDTLYAEKAGLRLNADYFIDVIGYDKSHFTLQQPETVSDSPSPAALSARLSENQNITDADTSILKPKIDTILEALGESDSYDDFENRLVQLSLGNNQALMQRLMFDCGKSRVQGQAQDNALKGSDE